MDLKQKIARYFRMGMKYREIRDMLYSCDNIKISLSHLKRILGRYGLWRRKNYTSLDDVFDFINSELQCSGQMHGYRWMHRKCVLNGLNVTKETVRVVLRELDPVGTEMRKRRRLRRRDYISKGPNYCWHMDGYDKLKPYGIAIHGCIDGFSRKIIWLRAYTTNNDPFVIAGYYSNAIKQLGGCPKRIRADFGTENVNVEVMQRTLREQARTCFLYGTSPLNQRIEAWWGILRRETIQFWMNFFMELKENDMFAGTYLDKELIRMCFLDIIQVSTSYTDWHFPRHISICYITH